MEEKWFVMINGGRGTPIPLRDDDDRTLLFSTEAEAIRAGEANRMGAARGFEVYDWGWNPED